MKNSVRKHLSNFNRAIIEILSLLLPLKEQAVFADTYIWKYYDCYTCGETDVCYPQGQNHQIRQLMRVTRIFGGILIEIPTGTQECVQGC